VPRLRPPQCRPQIQSGLSESDISPSGYAITSPPRSWLARVTDGLKPSAAARRIFFKPLVMTLCGEVAQRRAGWDRSDEYHRVRCRNDRKQWLSVLDVITETRADGVAMMREMTSEAHRIIDAHWELLEELARELLQYRKLDEHEIKQIVGDLSPVEQSPDRSRFSRVDGYLVTATSKPIRSREFVINFWHQGDQ
jgi:hypothetical protein